MDSSPVLAAILTKRAVLFDLFHTLIALNRRPGDGQQLHELLGVPREAFLAQLRGTARNRLVGNLVDPFAIVAEWAHGIDRSITDDAIGRTADRIVAVFSEALKGVPDRVISMLAHLRDRGKLLGLVSNASTMEVSGWSGSPLAPLFNTAVFSCFCGSVKPEERIYRICTDGLGVVPGECAFVGDGESNELEGAKNLGMTTVMTTEFIGHLAADEVERRRRSADYVVLKLDELV